jgi:hypothetical protein
MLAAASGAGEPRSWCNPESGEGDRVAEQRRGVLVVDGRDRGVSGRADVLPQRDAACRRFLPELAHRGEPRGAVEQAAEAEHGKGQQGHLHLAWVEQALGALPDRQDAADDEDAERGQERPVEQLGAVPEGVAAVGPPSGAAKALEQQQLVAGVGKGVQRLGEEPGRAGQRGSDRLGNRHREVGANGDRDGPQALSDARRGVVPADRRAVAACAGLQHRDRPPQPGEGAATGGGGAGRFGRPGVRGGGASCGIRRSWLTVCAGDRRAEASIRQLADVAARQGRIVSKRLIGVV